VAYSYRSSYVVVLSIDNEHVSWKNSLLDQDVVCDGGSSGSKKHVVQIPQSNGRHILVSKCGTGA